MGSSQRRNAIARGDELQRKERVMEDKFTMSTGQAHKLAMAFGRNGWTNADVKELCGGDLLAQILQVVRGEAEVKTPELPTEITVGGVTYEVLSFLREGETSVRGDVMVERAKEMRANLGEEDGQRFLEHWQDIPPVLDGEVEFIFTDWRKPDDREGVVCVRWFGDRWVQSWDWLDLGWVNSCRVLRRKSVL